METNKVNQNQVSASGEPNDTAQLRAENQSVSGVEAAPGGALADALLFGAERSEQGGEKRRLKVSQEGVEFGELEYEHPPCGASFHRGFKLAEHLIKSAIQEGVDITNLEKDWCIVSR